MSVMSNPAGNQPVPVRQRRELLLKLPGFSALPADVIEQLATGLQQEEYPRGNTIVAEGEVGDRLFVIVRGRAEVFTTGTSGLVALAKLEAGDMFGEIALLIATHRRQATVKALDPLLTLSLSAASLDEALAAHPEARIDLAAAADALLSAKFLKRR